MKKLIIIIKKILTEDTDNSFIQFIRYIFVGGTAFVVDYGVMVILAEIFLLNSIIASTISFVLGLIVNYLLSVSWIFKSSKMQNRLAEFCAFALIGIIGLVINTIIIWLADTVAASHMLLGEWFPQDKYYMIGKIISTVVVFLWNFFARKYIVFEKKTRS